jgi:hypothetical protein
MLHKLLVASLLALGSTVTLLNPANAQTTNPHLNQLLQDTDKVISDTNIHIKRITPEVERYQRYLNQLSQACLNGNTNACQEYNLRMRRQERWQEHLNQQYLNWIRNRR